MGVQPANARANYQPVKGRGLDANTRVVIVVNQVSFRCSVTARELDDEAEIGLRPAACAHQDRWQRNQVTEGREQGVLALDLAPAGHLSRSGRYAAEAWPARG